MPVNKDAALNMKYCHREKIQHKSKDIKYIIVQILYQVNPFERQIYLTKLRYKQIYIVT